MKTEEEIEQLAQEWFLNDNSLPYGEEFGFIKGYTQCQEDMKKDVEYWQGEFDHWHQQAMEMADKKYTEEDIKKCWILATNYALNQSNINLRSFINSLNKQD